MNDQVRYLLWLCLLFGGINLVLLISYRIARKIMKPKDIVDTGGPSEHLRRADIVEQDQRLKELGIELPNKKDYMS